MIIIIGNLQEKKLYGRTYMGIVRSTYLINEKGKSYSYPLIDLEKLDVGVDVSWEEIFRSNVTVLITDDWSNQMWGDILVLEKYGVSISVKIYATGNLVFHILKR